MTDKTVMRELTRAGFILIRNGNKHAIYEKDGVRISAPHGKIKHGTRSHILRKIREASK